MRESVAMRHAALGVVALALIVGVALLPPMTGPANYNCLADERSWFGVPNTLNVLSNLPFAVLGLLGLVATFARDGTGASPVAHPWERWPFAALFTGVALTALGSGYYHLAPAHWSPTPGHSPKDGRPSENYENLLMRASRLKSSARSHWRSIRPHRQLTNLCVTRPLRRCWQPVESDWAV
jgi:hypothetical protein